MTAGTRTRHRLASTLAAVTLLFLAGPASGQEEDGGEAPTAMEVQRAADQWQLPEPDTANWRCRNCPFPEGWNGYYELGAGIVSDDSFRFGDYRGLEEEGFFPVLEGEALYRGEEGDYREIRAEELGLDSRSVRAEAGRQGRYGVWLEYDQLPHLVADDTRTVFTGAGSANLGLPGGWVRAGTTDGMTALDGSLRDVDIEQERKSLGLGLEVLRDDRWHYNVEYRNDRKEGNRVQGASFLFRSALLPAPVDYETESVDASVAYVRDRWQVEAGFHTSMFTNENEALVWDNPFTGGPGGADQGRLALPPDNQFNQVSLSGSWRSRDSLTVAGRVAVGRMEQNEDFLAPTINGGLAAPNPPRNDLNGEVDTRKLDLRVTGQPTQRLTARVQFLHDERDNDSPRDDYVQVSTDEIVSAARANRPYSYERTGTEATLDYRLSQRATVFGEVGRENFERTLQEVEETRTDTYSIGVRGMMTDRLSARLQQIHEERDGSYEPLGLSGGNPDLRKFNMARRDRDATRLALDYLATDRVTLGLSMDVAEDEYTESDIGLTRARDRSYSLDLTASLAEGVTAYAFTSMQRVDADILGQDSVDGAEWFARQDDDYQTLGIGLQFAYLPGKFARGGLDLTYSTGDTDIRVDKSGVGVSEFPEVTTRLYTLNLTADRTLGKNSVLRLGYLLEGFSEQDFQRDGVDPDTIPAVLTLGEGTPGYTVHVIQLSLRYEF